MQEFIKVRGARVNELKNVDVDIPLRKLTCFAGPSGSGKSSLAFHTLYTESKRRLLNSLSNNVKFFSEKPPAVDVDLIEPVLPVFGLPQSNPVVGTRSNVSDVMRLTELFQNFYYFHGQEKCPEHNLKFESISFETYLSNLVLSFEDKVFHVFISKDDFIEFLKDTPFPNRSVKSKRSKKVDDFDKDHDLWEVTRFKKDKYERVFKNIEVCLKHKLDIYILAPDSKKYLTISYDTHPKCPEPDCEYHAIKNKSIGHFSPYSPLGACDECGGFGEILEFDEDKLIDKRKSVVEGGVKFLQFKRFQSYQKDLEVELKRKKISVTKPIEELPNEFYEILFEGEGRFDGINYFLAYLERKKYKMHVRIMLRGLQKGIPCGSCNGSRLDPVMKSVFLGGRSFQSIYKFNIKEAYDFFIEEFSKSKNNSRDFKKLRNKIVEALKSAVELGLGHLSLLRKAKSLSSGEYQRLLILKFLSYEGTDSLFIFDEPSLGLSLSEKKLLLKNIQKLIKQDNTVVLIDHCDYLKKNSDHLIMMGPGPGHLGGEVVFTGKYDQVKNKVKIKQLESKKAKHITVKAPTLYNRTYNDFKIALSQVNLVTGESGSGKSASLINVMANHYHYNVYQKYLDTKVGEFKSITNHDFDDVIVIDSNLNRFSSRSTVGSMTDLYSVMKKHFLSLPVCKAMGLKPGHLSNNSELGQCPKCEGKGKIIVEMQYMEDIVLECEDCDGKKLKKIYADLHDGKRTLYESYSKPISDVFDGVKLTPKFQRILEYIKLLNLEYLSLDRTISSLSGGEKQRIYLLSKLIKSIDNSLLIIENLSFGLSLNELNGMVELLESLSNKNNTIVVIDQDDNLKKSIPNQVQF